MGSARAAQFRLAGLLGACVRLARQMYRLSIHPSTTWVPYGMIWYSTVQHLHWGWDWGSGPLDGAGLTRAILETNHLNLSHNEGM